MIAEPFFALTSNYQTVGPPKKYNKTLDALRGLLAVIVALFHFFDATQILQKMFPPFLFDFVSGMGPMAVIAFFALSGYVIGLSNKSLLSKSEIIEYLKNRLIRLYPIYFVIVIVGIILSSGGYPIKTIFHNFTFTQIMFSPVISEVGPIWSLHYEVLFYLLFIPVSYFRIHPLIATLLSVLVGTINFAMYPLIDVSILTSYAFGFAVWSGGLTLARYTASAPIQVNYTRVMGAIFLILAWSFINYFLLRVNFPVFSYFESKPLFNDRYFFSPTISYLNVSCIPFLLFFILQFSGAKVKYLNWINTAFWVVFGLIALNLLRSGDRELMQKTIVPATLLGIGVVLFYIRLPAFETVCKVLVNATTWLGGISYAIYLTHIPVLGILDEIDTLNGYRAFIYLPLVIGISYLLEKQFQPWAKKLLA